MDIDRFFRLKPELGKIFHQYGHCTIDEYIDMVHKQVESVDFSCFSQRSNEFDRTYLSVVSSILGRMIARRSLNTLKHNRLVSTADHQGIITHPFFLSTTYARSLYTLNTQQECVVTFTCAGVSLSNSSFPRGMAYHSTSGELSKIFFQSLALKHTPVYCAPPISLENIQTAIDTVSNHRQIKKYLESLRDDNQFMNLSDYDSQCTYASHRLWKLISGFEDIDLIYLSQERLTNALLTDNHLNQKTLINQLLFNEKVQCLFEKHFDGITGAFSSKDQTGTCLFWGFHKGKRVSLFRTHNTLTSHDGACAIELTPESLSDALKSKTIFPSMALCFITLSFYYGFVCGGGFSQVQYLKELKEAWMNVLNEMGNSDESDMVANIAPSIFLGEVIGLVGCEKKPLYLLDFLISEKYIDYAKYHKTTMYSGFVRMCTFFGSTLSSVFD